MQQQFTDNARKALELAEQAAKELHHNYIGTEHLLIGLIHENSGVAASVLTANGITEVKLLVLIKELVSPSEGKSGRKKITHTPRALKVLEESHKEAIRFKQSKTGTEHLLIAILKESDNIAARLIKSLNILPTKLYADVIISMGEDPAKFKDEMGNRPMRRKRKEKSVIAQYSRDLTKLALEGKLDPVIGRENEIIRIVQTLSRRSKNNPCLIGEAGVGKTAIVEGLALKIVQNQVPPVLRNKRILTLNITSMVAGSKYRGEFEERMKQVMKEIIEAGDIILFLDEFHTLIGAGKAEGTSDAANILKPSLARGEIQLVGATTIAEYRKYVEKDPALERRLQPITVEEPSEEDAIAILNGIKLGYEKHHKVQISDLAIIAAVELSSRYINDRNLPDKAVDVIDEAAAAIKLRMNHKGDKITQLKEHLDEIVEAVDDALRDGDLEEAKNQRKMQERIQKKINKLLDTEIVKEVVDEDDIAKVVSIWTGIPVSKLAEKESEKLLRLEDVLKKRVIGQSEAVTAVSKAVRRGRVGIQDPNRPIGSFLFLGPTGVGKTELSKTLAETMFGSQASLVRVDMSEFMEQHSVSKLIGSPPGYVGFDEGGQLSEKVRKKPYSVVLFDEIEKAHPDVFNMLLQVLDDGHITDSQGRKVNFKNTVLIMTSNVGASKIMEPKNLGFLSSSTSEQEYEKMKSSVIEEVKKLFKPEFVNRIDDMIVFHPLQKEDMKQIITIVSKNLIERCKKQMNLTISISSSLKEHIVEKYSNLKMGARPLKRAVQSVIEDALAEEILQGNVKEYDTVKIGYRGEKVTFQVINSQNIHSNS
ncbi:MAG: ATP-dependent Clp protease ATP-binding subunit [Eubacteriales bacterium]